MLIDTGCRVQGYNSDITRTYVFGEPTPEHRRVWEVERRLLGLALDLPHPPMLRRGFAEHIGAGDVGVVALDLTAGVDQHQIAFTQGLGAGQAMRILGRLAELDGAEARAGVGADPAVGLVDEAADLGGGHARREHQRCASLDLQRHGLSLPHQGEFGGRLDPTAAVHDRRRIDQRERRARAAQTVDHEER